MSTIKSSSEHLTLNADGASKDIKFQANGVEKASISSAGLFTSTTIDATKLTGNLPAISGASLTGITTGKVLKVVSSGAIDQSYSSTATSYTAVTSHTLSITPSATSSKVWITMSFCTRSVGTVVTYYTIYRDSTNLGSADGLATFHDDTSMSDNEQHTTLTFLDSPSTTSATAYVLYAKSASSGDTVRVNGKGSDSVITLMEIGA
jgi:hypothetical protein